MAESVVIETPEHVAFSVEVADVGSRFLALMIDFSIQGVAMFGLGIIALAGWYLLSTIGVGLGTQGALLQAIAAIGLLLSFTVMWGYHIIFETWSRGQSPGKRLVGLRVVKDNGAPVGFLDSAVRNLVRIADMLPTSYAIGVTAVLLSRDRKRLGDMAAGTLVVREPRTRPVAPVNGLDLETQRILVEFLARADELDAEARERIAVALATRLDLPERADGAAALTALSRLRAPARAAG